MANLKDLEKLINKKVEFTYDEGDGIRQIIMVVIRITDFALSKMIYGMEQLKKGKQLPFTIELPCIIDFKEV